MLIILEGNECNFKTTIANKLSKKLGYQIVKGSSFEQSTCTQDELFNKFMEYAQLENTVLDRFYISNLVYAPIYKDFSMINNKQQKEIERVLRDNRALMILLDADVEVLKERMRKRGDDYVKEDKLEEINLKYKEVMQTVSIPHVVINTEETSYAKENNLDITDLITNSIINLAKHIQQEGEYTYGTEKS